MLGNFIKYKNFEISEDYLLSYDPCDDFIEWNEDNEDVRDMHPCEVLKAEAFVRMVIRCGDKN